ncbi:class A beta-lactamase-related serine hydrolase [Nocardia neocaledoniensis]|uniref:class A beta-lactamase-related serine hydrolase n=1 Tax=Nocardia neocaledoniensis TaxID=236511 RepID=UPI002455EE5D|nr:class A beta-lactamase-related serine hydrolase [Nocardia neocaledoniensis]
MSTAVDRIRAVFADAGCTGWLHARRCDDSGDEVCVGGSERVVIASVYKLLLFVAFCREVAGGRIDPNARITVDPAECTPGPTGLAALHDPVTLSRRDLATSMMTVSDNAAADVLLGEIGLAAVTELAAEVGLTETRVVGGTADQHRSLVRDTDTHTTAEAFAALADNDEAWTISAYDPSYASATTPEEMTRFLRLLWTGRLLPAEHTAFARAVLGKQIWPHRIAAAFPHRGVLVAGKTGTIGVIRNEVAVVAFPGETPVAVAVFTRAARADPTLPVVDAAIGEAARIAVTELRRPH